MTSSSLSKAVNEHRTWTGCKWCEKSPIGVCGRCAGERIAEQREGAKKVKPRGLA